jgi:hypothetical protein
MHRGKSELVRRLIEAKFGQLPADLSQRTADASDVELDELAEKLLSANRLEDL